MKRLPIILLAMSVTVLAVILASHSPPDASADPIAAGHDLFQTLPGHTEVDLTGVGLGVVPLKGNPIEGEFGFTDTIVERKAGIDPLPPSDTIDIEIVALSLVSVNPIDLTPLGVPFIGVFSDLHATINEGGAIPGIPQPDALPPSIGQMTIRHEYPDGGTFDSCFGTTGDPVGTCPALGVPNGGVYADAIFTIVGGDPNNGGHVLFSLPAPRIAISGVTPPNTWCHDAPPNYPNVVGYGAGGFYPGCSGPIDHDGPHGPLKSAISGPIGGITELFVDGSGTPSQASGSDGNYVVLTVAAAAAGAIVVLAAGGCYARRRWLAK